jgi:GntR family transcriptional regulator/MocR family aminotransferase
MAFHVSLVGRKDLSGEIYRQIRRAILDGRLRPGDRLSPSRELARALAVSRMTVTVAYERLAGEGFVTSRVGGGTFVNELVARRRHTRSRSEDVLRSRAIWESIALPTAFEHPAEFDFRTGLPDTSLFPHRAWRRLVARALRSSESLAGPYEHPAGHRGLRTAIARHLGTSRGVEASADDIIVTSGTQQALDVLARVLLAPREKIAVEDPGYAPARRLFKALGLRVIGIPVDRSGLVVDALPRGIRAVYVTPSHQYPLGVAMTLPRRQALLAWAERNNAAVIEDDYDSEFRFGGRPLDPLQMLDAKGHVIYVGSFSKTLLPALRLGFLVSPRSLRSALHKAKFISDWHTSTLAQAALALFIDDGGFARHIRNVNRIYRDRHEILVSAITRDFADHLDLIPSNTGLHIAALARKASARQIAAVARRAIDVGVAFQMLSSFAVGETARAGIVLGYGAIATSQVKEGLHRLRKCFDGELRRSAR